MVFYLVLVFVGFVASLDGTIGIEYGPSIVSLTKFNKEVYGPTLFRPETGRVIYLEDYPNFSVVVPLAPESATATSNQVFISRRVSGPGEFLVVAPEGHGVMAVIQSLDLRTAPSGCNDFIQFGEVDSETETTGTCGKVENRDGSLAPLSLVGPRMFVSPSEQMKVLFYHGFIWGLVRDFNFDLLDPQRNAVLKAEIVFTAYKDCDNQHYFAADNVTNYKSCTGSKIRGRKKCILEPLFCDSLINCALEESFGSDEYVANCLPTLFNLLLPRVFSGIRARNSFNNTVTPITASTTSVPLNILSSTTTPTKSTSAISTTSTSSSFVSKSNKIKTTTNTPPISSIPISTTHPPITTRTVLSEHFFSIATSADTPPATTSSPPPTPTNLAPSYDVRLIQLPPEFEQSTPPQLEQEKHSSKEVPQRQRNMTFSVEDDNMLSVEQGEGQVEQLDWNNDVNQNDTVSHFSTEESSYTTVSLILWIIFSILTLTAAALILRLYYCNNRVIWIPNPKALRVRRKRREFSVYSNNCPELNDRSKVKGSLRSSTSTFKETPPSYDILFPKSCLHDADVLP